MKKWRGINGGQLLIIMIATFGGCIEPYDPPAAATSPDYLVVDAFLDASIDTATVTLSRTLPVKSFDAFPREFGALVRIEDNLGGLHRLAEVTPGLYIGGVPNANPQNTYRLLIDTPDGHGYASDFISVKETPPIDSITWAVTDAGVQFSVTTHDATGSSQYFRWTYIETFEYHANYPSTYILLEDASVIPRPVDLQRRVCWNSSPSFDIMVASTAHLKNALVSKFPVSFIPFGSLELTVRYSLLVRQYALTEEAYEYWLNLQKSTEQLGGLFDPLPSEVKGNMQSTTHAGEMVLGFFNASTVQEKRTFLGRYDLPDEAIGRFRAPYCALDTLLIEDLPFAGTGTFLVDAIYPPSGPGGPIGYTTAEPVCVDCTLRGGTITKPPFWK